MSSKAQGVKVSVLRHHTFRGTEYAPGDSYTVDGDQSQTADQYVDTLRATGFARPADEAGQGPNVVEEVGEPGSTAVKPLSTENFVSEEPVTPEAKPAAAKPTKPAKVAKSTAKAAKQPAKSGGKK